MWLCVYIWGNTLCRVNSKIQLILVQDFLSVKLLFTFGSFIYFIYWGYVFLGGDGKQTTILGVVD